MCATYGVAVPSQFQGRTGNPLEHQQTWNVVDRRAARVQAERQFTRSPTHDQSARNHRSCPAAAWRYAADAARTG